MTTSFAEPQTEDFRREVRAWLACSLTPEFRRAHDMTEDEQTPRRRAWDRVLFEAGYAGLSWPVEFGGRGEGPILETVLFEELAAAHAPEGLGRIGRVMAGPMIMARGSDDQRRRFLPTILDGSQIWCLGFSEPQAGSDLPSISTRAWREDDVYRVRGRKTWTSHAHHADRCMLLARTATDRPKHQGMSMFLLDMRQEGVKVEPIITAAGDRHFNEVLLEDAVIELRDRLGEENEGWKVFRASLAFERGGAVALNHYLDMRRQCDVALECCSRRAPACGAAERAQRLSTEIELVRWHVMRVVETDASGRSAKAAQSVLKLFFSELWQELTAFGLGCGCQQHRELWRYQYLRSRAGTIYAGTSEIQRNMIARLLMQTH